MKDEHKELIHDYLNIDRQIKRIKQRMHNAEVEFYAQNFYGGTDYYDPIGIRNKGFRVDSRVSDYVDLIFTYVNCIKIMERKEYHFNRFLKSLDQHTYLSLKRRYNSFFYYGDIQELGHDQLVLDEIFEIEEAISFEFDKPLLIKEKKSLSLNPYRFMRNENSEETIDTIAQLIGI